MKALDRNVKEQFRSSSAAPPEIISSPSRFDTNNKLRGSCRDGVFPRAPLKADSFWPFPARGTRRSRGNRVSGPEKAAIERCQAGIGFDGPRFAGVANVGGPWSRTSR